MFRKDIVIGALGGFDETRKAADTEFFERIDTVFGDGRQRVSFPTSWCSPS